MAVTRPLTKGAAHRWALAINLALWAIIISLAWVLVSAAGRLLAAISLQVAAWVATVVMS